MARSRARTRGRAPVGSGRRSGCTDAHRVARGRERRHPREPRAVHPRERGRRRRSASSAPGERPRHRARAGDARVLGRLGRARQRLRRPRGRGPPATGSACRPARSRTRSGASGSREEEERGYYYGFSQRGALAALPPRAHAPGVPRAGLARTTSAVNRRFADAVVRGGRQGPDPDRARAGLPLRARAADDPRAAARARPSSRSGTSRGPTPSGSAICPWHQELLDGLLGSSIVGFHTQQHCNNFIDSVDRFLEARIDRERMSVVLGGRESLVRPYPISIEWPNHWAATAPPVAGVPARGLRRARPRAGRAARAWASIASTTRRASRSGCSRWSGCSSGSRRSGAASPSRSSPRRAGR